MYFHNKSCENAMAKVNSGKSGSAKLGYQMCILITKLSYSFQKTKYTMKEENTYFNYDIYLIFGNCRFACFCNEINNNLFFLCLNFCNWAYELY